MGYLFRAIWRSVGLTLFLTGLVLSPNVWFAAKALWLAGEGAIAEYRLRSIPPERYAAEIGTALDAGDGDLARSLVVLAGEQQVVVSAPLLQRIAALPPVDVGNVLGQGWNCIVNGDFDSEGGFACVVATDMTGVGDVRDLLGEGGHYLSGQPVNYFTLGVASVGLGLTVATVSSLGSALPLRAGASFLKAMSKVGKLPPKLAGEVGIALSRGIDKTALAETVNLATELRLGDMGRPLSRLFNPRSVALVEGLATDFGTIGKAGGVRAMKLSAGTVDSARDVKVLAKTADKYQGGYLGVMRLIGHGALRLADVMLTIGGWLVGAVLWVFGMLVFMLRWSSRLARLLARPFRRRKRRPVQRLEPAFT